MLSRILLLLGYHITTVQCQAVLGSDGFSRLSAVQQLDSDTFLKMMYDPTTNHFDVIIDVRTKREWDAGHIENATFLESLALFGDSSQISTPSELAGCEYCNIVAYDGSGARAATALQHLVMEGFKGRLYNGLGTSTWPGPIVNTDSVRPLCTLDDAISEQCRLAYLAYTSNLHDDATTLDTVVPTRKPFVEGVGTSNGMPPVVRIAMYLALVGVIIFL